MNRTEIKESAINLISEQTRIDGKVTFDRITRVHGVLNGEVSAKEGSTLILAETSMTEGTIRADTLIVDGFVRGEIFATKQVVISQTGRVVGNIKTASFRLEPGAYFEGACVTTPAKTAD